MLRHFYLAGLLACASLVSIAQDSVWVQLRPKYNEVGGLHRFFFGENYRQEWADSTYLPVIDISNVEGGLRPLRLGGGHQTVSLRLVSAKGNEWSLRNIEKDASILLPPGLRQTFAREVIDDAMSAQHPFSPLAVAEIAKAAGIPHANPVIGFVKDDTALGEFRKFFANRVCLLEEREPFGESDNSVKMFQELAEDNDNSVNAEAFIKARLLDLLIADWDRHPDQWRWVDTRKGKTRYYLGIPRDRDQAFYVNEGLFPGLASRPWFVPLLQGFSPEIKRPKYSLQEGSFLYSRPEMHLTLEKWMQVANEFNSSLTDTVFYNALLRMPASAWQRRHRQLFETLKARRDNIPQAVSSFYRFIHKISDLQLSNKHELVSVSDTAGGLLNVKVYKLARNVRGKEIMSATYSPEVTKEIRIFTGNGNDSVLINYNNAPIRLRIVGPDAHSKVHVTQAAKKVKVYNDTSYFPTNRYNVFKPLIAAGYNRDDGFLLGIGFQYTRQGFRKLPYASVNRLLLYHAFSTSAYRIRYSGEWIDVFDKTDMVATADIFAPQNTQNFFGKGNETIFDPDGSSIDFYRTRFRLYTLLAGLRWVNSKGWNFTVGPSVQHYRFDSSDNRARILTTVKNINSYDSLSIGESKTHVGAVVVIESDKKNSRIIPTSGHALNLRVNIYGGLNSFSKSFAQLIPEFSAYLPLNSKRSLVLANRIGAGISIGKTTFYQAMFTGGHDNLLGFRQYRFAGEHRLFNNLELRLRLANFTGYIIPGEFGMLGFYDVGRVWIDDEKSDEWHHGVGGGLYFAPAKMAVLSIVAGHSTEGWYPYIKLGFRF